MVNTSTLINDALKDAAISIWVNVRFSSDILCGFLDSIRHHRHDPCKHLASLASSSSFITGPAAWLIFSAATTARRGT